MKDKKTGRINPWPGWAGINVIHTTRCTLEITTNVYCNWIQQAVIYTMNACRYQIMLDCPLDALSSAFNRSMSTCEETTALLISSTSPAKDANLSLECASFIILPCNIFMSSLPIVVWRHCANDADPIVSGVRTGPSLSMYGRSLVSTWSGYYNIECWWGSCTDCQCFKDSQVLQNVPQPTPSHLGWMTAATCLTPCKRQDCPSTMR